MRFTYYSFARMLCRNSSTATALHEVFAQSAQHLYSLVQTTNRSLRRHRGMKNKMMSYYFENERNEGMS